MGITTLLLGLLVSGAAARAPRPLSLEWEAVSFTGPAVALAAKPRPLVAAFENVAGSPDRSVVALDPQTGEVVWRAAPAPGVAWGEMTLGEAGLGLTGTSPDGAALALLDPADGRVVWTTVGKAGEHLLVGADGGVAAEGACSLTVLDPRTGSVGQVVEGRAGASSADGGSGTQTCADPPRLLGAVDGRAVVLAPAEHGEGWRLFQVEGRQHPWYVDLADGREAPGVDWRTSTVWSATSEGLRVQRRNLATGALAWDSVFTEPGCAASARGFDGPAGLPTLLVRLCSRVVAVDPHDGHELWQADTGASAPLVVGAPSDGEPLPVGDAGLDVVWLSPAGQRVGTGHIEPGDTALPWGSGLLVRTSTGVALLDRAGTTVWALPTSATGLRLQGDLLLVTPSPDTNNVAAPRLVLRADTGEVLGTVPAEGEPVALVPLPGSNTRRLLVLVGQGIRAWRVQGS